MHVHSSVLMNPSEFIYKLTQEDSSKSNQVFSYVKSLAKEGHAHDGNEQNNSHAVIEYNVYTDEELSKKKLYKTKDFTYSVLKQLIDDDKFQQK